MSVPVAVAGPTISGYENTLNDQQRTVFNELKDRLLSSEFQVDFLAQPGNQRWLLKFLRATVGKK